MSERSFALACVGLALAFGIVVPDPGKAPVTAAVPAIVMEPPAPQQAKEDTLARIDEVPFGIHHAAPAKRDARPNVFWAIRSER